MDAPLTGMVGSVEPARSGKQFGYFDRDDRKVPLVFFLIELVLLGISMLDFGSVEPES